MHMVVLTRFAGVGDAEYPLIAGLIGGSAYDVRLKIAAGMPVRLATLPDAARAESILRSLKERGHGGLCCDLESLPKPTQHIVIRELLRVGPEGLSVTDAAGNPHGLPYPEIMALIRAISIQSSESTVTTHTKKLDLGRAVLTGGLMVRKDVAQTKTTGSEQREHVLYAFRKGRKEPWILREQSLRYQGLGALLKPTTLLNFQALVEVLRESAPQALFDQRLLTHKRRSDISALGGPANSRTVESSNADENALAAYFLAEAHLHGEL